MTSVLSNIMVCSVMCDVITLRLESDVMGEIEGLTWLSEYSDDSCKERQNL